MAVTNHSELSGLNIHTPFTWEVADSATRLALPVTIADIHKLCFQADNQSIYILTGVLPTVWVNSTSAGSTSGTLFSQSTPLSIWTITHNLGYKPTVQVMSLGLHLIDADVVHIDNNIFNVNFNSAFSGYAKYI